MMLAVPPLSCRSLLPFCRIPHPLTIITPFGRERPELSLESAPPAQHTSHNLYASFPAAGTALPTVLSSMCWRQGSQPSRALAPAVRAFRLLSDLALMIQGNPHMAGSKNANSPAASILEIYGGTDRVGVIARQIVA